MVKINLSETFFSYQGEGIPIGFPTFFIRFAECNLHCPWCDTKESWYKGRKISIPDLIKEIPTRCPNICITGGEPMLQIEALEELVQVFYRQKKFIVVQTNCTQGPTAKLIEQVSFWSISPKIHIFDLEPDNKCLNSILQDFLMRPEKVEIKFVVASKEDINNLFNILNNNPILSYSRDKINLIIQPEFNFYNECRNDPKKNNSLKSIVNHFHYTYKKLRFIPQIHKLVGWK